MPITFISSAANMKRLTVQWSFKHSAVMAVLLMACCCAQAQNASMDEDPASDDAIELKTTYVRPEYVEIERLRETKEIIVIPKEDLVERGNRTISDVLEGVPGVSVNTSGWGSIDLRGQGNDTANRNLQVMLDGAPITTLLNHPHSTNYDVVPVEELERIEIIPGGGSVLYGSGTAGGVINITTNLRSMKDPKTSAFGEWNSDGYRIGASVGALLNEKFSFLGTVSKIDRDLYFKNTYRNSNYYSAGIRWDLTETQSLTLRASRLEEDSQFIKTASARNIQKYGKDYVPPWTTQTVGVDENGQLIKRQVRSYLNGDRAINSYNLSYANDLTDRLHLTADSFYSDGYFSNNQYEDQIIDQESKGLKLKLDIDYLEGSDLLLGFDYTKQSADFNYIGSWRTDSSGKHYGEPYSFLYDKTVIALYGLNTLKRGDFSFTQGLRRELTKWEYDKTGNRIAGADTSDRWNTALELSAAWRYRDTGRIYARYERGYTVPDGLMISDQAVVNGDKVYKNTNAEDEKYDMYEIGLRDKVAFSTVSVSLWMSNTNNQLYRMYVRGLNDARTLNLLQTRRWGADVSLQQTIGRLTLTESYSWLKGRSDYTSAGSRFMDEVGKDKIDFTRSGLQKVPQHSLSVLAKYDFTDNFSGDIRYTYYGKYNNFLSDAEKETDGIVKSRQIVDTSLHFKPWEHLEIYAGVTNLFNEKYYDYVSIGSWSLIPGRERTYFVGLRGTY